MSFPPLHKAVREQNIPKIRSLIAAGADVNEKIDDEYQRTPLFIAVIVNSKEIVKILLEAGADVDALSEDGITPFFAATTETYRPEGMEIMDILLEAGANINHVADYGFTPLLWAMEEGFTETVLYLIEKGADIHHIADDGHTVLSLAMGRGNRTVLNELERRGVAISNTVTDPTNPTFSNAIVNSNDPTNVEEINISSGGARRKGRKASKTRKGRKASKTRKGRKAIKTRKN